MSEERRAAKLKVIRDLLARASSTTFEAEAEAARLKANELMLKFQIEETELLLAEDKRPEIEVRWMPNLRTAAANYEVRSYLNTMWRDVATFCQLRVGPTRYDNETPERALVGLSTDLDYFDLLFTSLYLDFVNKFAPTAEPGRPYIENLVALKEAGFKWAQIGERLWAIGQIERPYDRNMGVKFTKDYAKFCKDKEREQVRMHPEVYARSFVYGYIQGVRKQLHGMRAANSAAGNGSGAELVLRDRRADVENEFYNFFPDFKPHPDDCQCKHCVEARKPATSQRRPAKVRYATVDWDVVASGKRAGESARIQTESNKRMGRRQEIGS